MSMADETNGTDLLKRNPQGMLVELEGEREQLIASLQAAQAEHQRVVMQYQQFMSETSKKLANVEGGIATLQELLGIEQPPSVEGGQ